MSAKVSQCKPNQKKKKKGGAGGRNKVQPNPSVPSQTLAHPHQSPHNAFLTSDQYKDASEQEKPRQPTAPRKETPSKKMVTPAKPQPARQTAKQEIRKMAEWPPPQTTTSKKSKFAGNSRERPLTRDAPPEKGASRPPARRPACEEIPYQNHPIVTGKQIGRAHV